MFFLMIGISFLFAIGMCGVFFYRRHLFVILFSFEIIILSIILLFTGSSIFFDDLVGEIFSIFILAVAASESALGLAFTMAFSRLRGSVSIDFLNLLKA